jgi:glycosyltransferase involved in cell wall biosynthesis
MVVHLLHRELSELGHEVTVFGAQGSSSGVTELGEAAWSADLGGRFEDVRLATYLGRVFERLKAERFDVIHDHSGPAGVLLAMYSGAAPVVVHTLHGELVEPFRTFYKEVDAGVRLVAISASQAATAPGMQIAAVVHNAVEIPTSPPTRTRERYLIEVARITPDKGQDLAIEVARRAGRKLILAGKVERSGDGETYFEEKVEPFLGRTIEYYPNVQGQEKARLVARAAAGIFPLQWPEPFGLAMAECMVAGTPVLALNTGSATELIESGVTGFLGETVDDLVAAAEQIDDFDHERCAAVARQRFSPRRMAEEYLEVYRGGSPMSGRQDAEASPAARSGRQ